MLSKARRRLKKFWRCERGTQMIEFSIALPFLLLMFAGTAELGRMFYTYTTLAKATRAGARYASTSDTVSNDCQANNPIKNVVICGNAAGCGGVGQPKPVVAGLKCSDITVTPPPTAVASVKYVTVSISYNYTPLVFNLQTMTGSSALSLNKTFTPGTRMRYMQ